MKSVTKKHPKVTSTVESGERVLVSAKFDHDTPFFDFLFPYTVPPYVYRTTRRSTRIRVNERVTPRSTSRLGRRARASSRVTRDACASIDVARMRRTRTRAITRAFDRARASSATAARARSSASDAVADDFARVHDRSHKALKSSIDFVSLVRVNERPSAAYERLVRENVIRGDDAQRRATRALDVVAEDVSRERNEGGWRRTTTTTTTMTTTRSWFTKIFGGTDDERGRGKDGGAYVHGGPGSGKTFVMDLFYAALPGERGVEKRREHFHSFMLETHTKLHELRGTARDADAVGVYAKALARDVRVLCLDEFQIVDVADAMIIRRLLEALWAAGVKVVTTSNRHPDELYKNGLNRSQFLPCIAQIKERCVVHEMASERDYRLTGSAKMGEENVTWMSRGTHQEREAWLARRLQALAHERSFKPLQISIGGRLVNVRRAGGGIAHFDFQELCDSALGAADYTALASVFSAIGVGSVPRLSVERLDLLRRFITFIDVMYEHKVKLLVSAETEPAELFQSSSVAGASSRKNAARDEEFAWDRAVSRLVEMQSTEFQEAAWKPKAGTWLLEQARVKVDEVLPVGVLRSLWQRYDTTQDNVLDEAELSCLIGDLNLMRLGHRHVSDEQIDAFMSTVCQNSLDRQNARSNRYVTYEEFEKFGNEAFVACMRHR